MSKKYSDAFTSDGNAKIYDLAFLPRKVSFLNKTKFNSTTNEIVKKAYGFSSDANGTAYVEYFDDDAAAKAMNFTRITSGGFSFITRESPQFGAVVSASGADSVDKDTDFMTVNITSHGYQTGDVVWLSGTTGMLQIGGLPYTVTRVDANSFTIPLDTSAYTFAADATAVTAKQLLYPDLYVPFLCYVVGVTSATQAVVTTSVDHQFKVGQKVRFAIPDVWEMVELDGLEGDIVSIGTIDNAQSFTAVTDGSAVNAFTVDIDTSGFTGFDFPTSEEAAAGMDYATVYPIGDTNFGFVGPTPADPLGIPGAFAGKTGYRVIIGTGDGTQIMHANNDVCEVEFEFPDQNGASVSV